MRRPKITCGAIIKKKGKILLTKRNIAPYKNYWSLPGGYIEEGEKAKEAIIREVKEETGLDFKPNFWKYWDEIIPRIGWYAIVLIFEGSAVGKLSPDKKEVKELKWFSRKAIKKLRLAFLHKEILKDYFYESKI